MGKETHACLAGLLATKKIRWYNNSPPYVTARWPPQQIPPLNFLDCNSVEALMYQMICGEKVVEWGSAHDMVIHKSEIWGYFYDKFNKSNNTVKSMWLFLLLMSVSLLVQISTLLFTMSRVQISQRSPRPLPALLRFGIDTLRQLSAFKEFFATSWPWCFFFFMVFFFCCYFAHWPEYPQKLKYIPLQCPN